MSSAVERLEALEQAARECARREEEIATDRRRAQRAVFAAEEQLGRYFEGLGAGEPPDDAEEERLREELRRARERTEDIAWQAREHGAQLARAEAERQRDEWAREHFAELVAEEVPHDDPARDRLAAAWSELEAAELKYAQRVRRWHKLAPYGGLGPESIPPLPTNGDQNIVRSRFARGLESPTPRALVPTPEHKEDH